MLPLVLFVLVYGGGPELPAVRAKIASAAVDSGARVLEQAIDTALAERRAGWRSLSELAFFGDGQRAVDKAHRARERVELDEALRRLAEAEAIYEAHLAEPGVASLAGEVALERGVVLGELRHVDEAKLAFERALALAPGLTLTERHARPDVVRLLREVAGRPIAPVVLPARAEDPLVPMITSLRKGPSEDGLRALLAATGADAALVVAISNDGRRAVGTRVEAACSSEAVAGTTEQPGQLVTQLLGRACVAAPLAPILEDSRLQPPPVAAVAKPARRGASAAKRWPWIFAGAIGVAAAVIGVTVGVVAADPRYAVKIDGRSFGAP